MARRYALVIGISAYNSLNRLTTPTADAEAIAQLLEAHGNFQEVKRLPEAWNEQSQHSKVGSGALEGDTLWEELESFLVTKAKGKDALIYFSGHGISVESRSGKRQGYLASSDCATTTSNGKVVEQSKGIKLEDFAELIQKSEVSSLVLLLDCCHAGSMIEKPVMNQFLTEFSQKDYCMIAACRSGESAFEGRQYSIFTEVILQGLHSDRANKQGQVTGGLLFEFIDQALRQSGQEPIRSTWGGSIPIVDYRVVQALEPVDESISPYQGLKAFKQSTAQFFFGRDEVVKSLIKKLGQSSFVILVGASGSGKSSIVRAGLIPELEENGWKILEPIQPGVDAIANLKSSLEKFFRDKDQLSIYSRIHQQIDVGKLRPVLEALPGSEKVLLVIDQFEELFTLCLKEEQRQKFIDLLTDAAGLAGRFVIVLTMRVDFEADCLNYPTFAKFLDAQRVSIPALLGRELERAITEPAKFLGYQLEEGLLEAILRDIAQERNCLPLLQFALSKLWELRNQETRKLQVSHYKQLGQGENKIIGALNDHADVIYRNMTPVEQELGKRICLRLIRTGAELRDTRQRQLKTMVLEVAINETEREIVESVLEKLVHGRLLVMDEEWVDLGHEALMSGWGKLATWRESDRELRRLRDRVADARQEWIDHHNDDVFLMSKGLLSQTSKRLQELKPYLSQTEQEFYQQSLSRDQENTSYQTELSQLKQQFQNVQARLIEKMQGSENTQITNTLDEVGNALVNLENFEQRMHSSKLAVDWLNNVQGTLVERLARKILRRREFPNNNNSLSSVEKILLLSQDINYYINWFKDSLTRGEPIDSRLDADMKLPKKFYGEAFDFFREDLQPVGLTEDANTEFNSYLNYLIRYISYEND